MDGDLLLEEELSYELLEIYRSPESLIENTRLIAPLVKDSNGDGDSDESDGDDGGGNSDDEGHDDADDDDVDDGSQLRQRKTTTTKQ